MHARVLFLASVLAASAGPGLAQQTPEQLFADNCAACHQAKGQGVAGAFPALAGNPFVVGDPAGPAWVVTHGRGGMPNFSEDLDDEQLAAILSFIRASWGNKAAPLAPADVAAVRGKPAPPNTQEGLPFH